VLSVQAFWLPKAGNTTKEYEDAFDYSIAERRFAVADGATDSAFAGHWARILGSTEQRYVKFRSSTKGYETLVKTHAISPRTPIYMKKTPI
jgi:hypothetical protein